MSNTPYEMMNGEAGTVSGEGNILTIHAGDAESIALPNADFVKNAEILREGQDLVLEGPDGAVVVIEDYFNADPAPALHAPNGETLTPQLVESFVQNAGPLQYADAGAMSDESPVGSVNEVTGKATVTRTDGTTETITIGTPIFQGDIVETEGEGAVNLVFIDETSLAVSQNAKLAIDEYVFDPSSESGVTDVSILRGLFVFTSGLIGRDDPDDVNIDTPMGSIGIRGTVIAGNIDTGEITVMEGAIVLRAFNGSEMTLAKQFETAKFDMASGNVVHMGETSPESFESTFGAVKSVAPVLFTGLPVTNDAPQSEGDVQQPGHNESTGPDTPADADNPLPIDGQQSPPLPEDSVTFTDTTFGGTDSGFVDSSGTNDDSTTNLTSSPPPPSSTTLPPPPPPSSTTDGADSNSLPPPPPPPNGGSGGSSGSTGPIIIDLRTIGGTDGFRILGSSGEHFGSSVAALGDINLNGLSDFLITNDLTASGTALRFDGPTPSGSQGVGSNDTSMPSISGIGDFDGDGTLDFIIGAPNSDFTPSGNIFINSSTAVSFTAGLAAGDTVGREVSGIGDVNGDGLSDVIIGAPGTGANDEGASYLLFGTSAPGPLDASALGASEGTKINGSGYTNGWFGQNVSGAGDFNNDGFSDFMVAELENSSDGHVHMFMGSLSPAYANPTGALYSFAVDTDGSDIPVMHMGDLNGDGTSDIAIADTLNNEIHFLFGGGGVDTNLTDGVNSNGYTVFNSGTGEIDGGGYVGDFNGDGYDDGAFVIRNGTVADIFVLYGTPGAPPGNLLDMQDLYGNDGAAFHMIYDVGHTGSFNFEISTAGDVDGDGFDDMLVGTPDAHSGDGAVAVVYGRNDDALGSDGDMMHIAGQTTAMDNVIANAANQHLVGNANGNILDGNGFSGISFRAGAGNDTIRIYNDNFMTIDGGTGIDKVEIFSASNLDFASFGSEAVSGIEKFALMQDNQTVTLGIDDIFRLMQESQDIMSFAGPENRKVLKIADVYEFINGTDSGGTTLNIDNNTGGGGTLGGLGFTADGTIADGGITYNVYDFGGVNGYALLIDQNIENVAVV